MARSNKIALSIDHSIRLDLIDQRAHHIAAAANRRHTRGGKITPRTTPVLVELCIGLEINGYLPAEFLIRPPRLGSCEWLDRASIIQRRQYPPGNRGRSVIAWRPFWRRAETPHVRT